MLNQRERATPDAASAVNSNGSVCDFNNYNFIKHNTIYANNSEIGLSESIEKISQNLGPVAVDRDGWLIYNCGMIYAIVASALEHG